MNATKSHIALLSAGMIFGANYWIAKSLMPEYFSPPQILFFRISVSAALFWLAGLFYPKDTLSRKELLRIALCSLLGVVLNQYLFFEGLKLSHPVQTAILHTTNPIFVLIFAALIIGEKAGWLKIFGIVLGTAGALGIILQNSDVSFSTDTLAGNLLIIGNILCYSLYLVLIKPVMEKHNSLTVIKWAFLYGFLMNTPFTVSSIFKIQWDILPGNIWFSLIFVVLGATFLAYLLTIFALKFLPALVVGFYVYLQPVIAAVIGWIIYHDKPTIMNFVAAIMIFTGVYLVNRPGKNEIRTYVETEPGANP